MGREVHCQARWPGGAGEVKALLESHALILRGPVKRTLPLSTLERVKAEAGALSFRSGSEVFELSLGEKPAASWAKKILAPPPSLAAKLGLGPEAAALVLGPVDDAALTAALEGVTTAAASEAAMALAVVTDSAQLQSALQAHATLRPDAPIWIVNRKGKAATFGETAIRTAMRGLGFMDNKTCAVSETYSATRYARPKAN